MKVGVLAILMAFLLAAGIPFGAMAGTAVDTDGDTLPDASDNCTLVPNAAVDQPLGAIASQCDTDQDGYGNACDPDVNNDGIVGIPDFTTFSNGFNGTDPLLDFTCDDIVGIPDFTTFSNMFNGPPGPSGLSCAGTITCP